jgi:hypothetical protein
LEGGERGRERERDDGFILRNQCFFGAKENLTLCVSQSRQHKDSLLPGESQTFPPKTVN